MGSLRACPNQCLLVGKTKNAKERSNHKGKEKRNIEFKPKEEFDPTNVTSCSKTKKHQRFNKLKCTYYKKGNHTKKYCMKKAIYHMSKLLKQHNTSILEGARKADSRDKTEDHDERCHALKASFSISHAFLID